MSNPHTTTPSTAAAASALITFFGGTSLIEDQATPGSVTYSRPMPVGTYGGAEVTLLAASGIGGRLTVEGSMDLGTSWSYAFSGPIKVHPGEPAQQMRFSTLDPAGGHQGCTHFRLAFEALPDDRRVAVRHISGNGHEYRAGTALLPTGQPQRGPLGVIKRWASKLRGR